MVMLWDCIGSFLCSDAIRALRIAQNVLRAFTRAGLVGFYVVLFAMMAFAGEVCMIVSSGITDQGVVARVMVWACP